MRNLIISGAVVLLGTAAIFVSFHLVYAQTDGPAITGNEVDGLQCTLDDQTEYLLQSPNVAPVSASPSTAFMGPERADIVAALEGLDLPGGTSFVVVHEPSMDVFVKTCAEGKCTAEEFYEPELACLREHRGGCFFAAVKYQQKTYCLLKETE